LCVCDGYKNKKAPSEGAFFSRLFMT